MPLIPSGQYFSDGMWAGRRAFVVGGGKSLQGFPFELLEDEIVFACNRSFECGVADVIVAADRRFFDGANVKKFGPGFQYEAAATGAVLCWATGTSPNWEPEVNAYHILTGTKIWGSTLKEGVSPGDTGIRAANLATILGCDPVYLLGIDMRTNEADAEQDWWHRGYGVQQKQAVYSRFRIRWEEAAESGKIPSRIVNLNPDSALEGFPKARWQDVLL